MVRPSPPVTPDTKPYWDAANRRELWYQVCAACGHVQFYPRGHCMKCRSVALTWQRSDGKGVVHTFSIVYRPPNDSFRSLLPYVIALVDMQEGFRLMTNMVNVSPEAMTIGMPVRIVFEETESGQMIPQAAPS
jgi:uncharacterized protein